MTTPDNESVLPRFHSNGINVGLGPYDATITFLELDPTALPENQVGPHQATVEARVQVVTPVGQFKAMIPILGSGGF